MDVFCADRDGAAAFHGVARIQAKIEDRQFEFAGIDLDRPQIGLQLHVDRDVSAQRAVEDLAHALELRRKVDGLWIHGAAAREREQMMDQPRPSRDCTSHAVEDALTLLRPDVALEQLQSVRENRQQVVEIVSHTTGQLTDRLEFLGVPEGLLGMTQPLLIAQPLRHVINELVSTDTVPVIAIAQCALKRIS